MRKSIFLVTFLLFFAVALTCGTPFSAQIAQTENAYANTSFPDWFVKTSFYVVCDSSEISSLSSYNPTLLGKIYFSESSNFYLYKLSSIDRYTTVYTYYRADYSAPYYFNLLNSFLHTNGVCGLYRVVTSSRSRDTSVSEPWQITFTVHSNSFFIADHQGSGIAPDAYTVFDYKFGDGTVYLYNETFILPPIFALKNYYYLIDGQKYIGFIPTSSSASSGYCSYTPVAGDPDSKDVSFTTPYNGIPIFASDIADEGISIHDYYTVTSVTAEMETEIKAALIPEYLPYYKGLARYGSTEVLALPHTVTEDDYDSVRGYDFTVLFDFPDCLLCDSGCDSCNNLGVLLPALSYDVTFTFPDKTSTVKHISSLTTDLCLEVWNTNATVKANYDFGHGTIYKNDRSLGYLTESGYTIDSADYKVFLMPQSYALTWNLNLPSGATGYCLGKVAENGEYNSDSTYLLSSVCCVDSLSYSSSDVPPTLPTAVLSVSIYNFSANGYVADFCSFKGWARDPEGSDIVFDVSKMTVESGEDGNSSSYVPTSALGIIYLHSDTVLYAVWELTSFNVVYHPEDITLGPNSPTEWVYPNSFSVPAPSKSGNVFLGWYLDSDFSAPLPSDSLPASTYYSSGTLNLYAEFYVPEFKFRSCDSDGNLSVLASSVNDIPVAYSGATMSVTGFPLFTITDLNVVVDRYVLTYRNSAIAFYRNRVVVTYPDSPNMETQYFNYPYTLTIDSYSEVFYADAVLYDVTQGESDKNKVYFNIWEWSFKKVDGEYVGIKTYLGHTSRLDSPLRNILSLSSKTPSDYANYIKVAYLLQNIGLSETRKFYRFDGDFSLQNAFGEVYLKQKGDVPYGSVNVSDVHIYADDENTKAYLEASSISAPDIVPAPDGDSSGGSSSGESSFFSSFFNSDFLKSLLIVAVIVLGAWLFINLFGSSRKRR